MGMDNESQLSPDLRFFSIISSVFLASACLSVCTQAWQRVGQEGRDQRSLKQAHMCPEKLCAAFSCQSIELADRDGVGGGDRVF